jgi:hypothetical protein
MTPMIVCEQYSHVKYLSAILKITHIYNVIACVLLLACNMQ